MIDKENPGKWVIESTAPFLIVIIFSVIQYYTIHHLFYRFITMGITPFRTGYVISVKSFGIFFFGVFISSVILFSILLKIAPTILALPDNH